MRLSKPRARVVAGIVLVIFSIGVVVWSRAKDRALAAATMAFDQGDYSKTLTLIAQAEEQRGRSFDSAMLAAECYRYYGLKNEFEQRLAQARATRPSDPKLAAAAALFDTHQGRFERTPLAQVRALEELEVATHVAVEAVVMGSLAVGKTENLRSLIDRLNEAPKAFAIDRRSYLQSLLLHASGEHEEAGAQLRRVLSRAPGLEMAWLALAETYAHGPHADRDNETSILEQVVHRFPINPLAAAKLAKVLRTQGLSSYAASQLQEFRTNELDTWEQFELDLDRGNYAACTSRLGQMGLGTREAFQPSVDRMFRSILADEKSESDEVMGRLQLASIALALHKQHEAAHQLITLGLDRVARVRRIADLRTIRALAPNEPIVEQMLKNAEDVTQDVLLDAKPKSKPAQDPAQNNNDLGLKTYRVHCAQCHGEQGDGLGRAARHLASAPRSFTDEPMRYVSSLRGLATENDLKKTIVEGLRGASMPAFPQLSKEEVAALVLQIRQFQRVGYQRRYIASYPERTDRQAQSDWIDEKLESGPELEVAEIPASNEEFIDAGKQLFRSLACNQCHRESDTGEQRRFVDSLGRTMFARDFPTEPLRRGEDVAEIYKRIVLGMPGTPHPALSGTKVPDIAALIYYVLSIAPSESRATNYERALPFNGPLAQ